jgi:hypothetical protein
VRPASTLFANRRASILAAAGTLLVGCILAVAGDGVAAGVTAAFFIGAPATAIAVPLRVFDPLARIVLALTAAVVVDALVAETMLVTNRWSIPGGMAAVGVISAIIWLATSAIGSYSAAAGTERRFIGHSKNEGGDSTP